VKTREMQRRFKATDVKIRVAGGRGGEKIRLFSGGGEKITGGRSAVTGPSHIVGVFQS